MTATNETSVLGTFAATLFALLNPLGMLPVFIGYTAGMRVGVQRWLAIFVSITVLGLMLVFLFAGTALLNFFGITLDAFRIAGGILLLLIGIRTVAQDPVNKAKDLMVASEVGVLREAESVYGQIVVPLAMPAAGWTRRHRQFDSVRWRSQKRHGVLGTSGCGGGGFLPDTRDSAFGRILATTIWRYRFEHPHAHSRLHHRFS